MKWDDAMGYYEHGHEEEELDRGRKLDYQRPRSNTSQRSRRRQGSSRKVACGIAARRNKRWKW